MFDLVTYALLFIGTPYIWGGNSLIDGGVDCSGFIQQILKSENIDPRGDQTAQALFNELKGKYETHSVNPVTHIKRNHLLFFGTTTDRISHVALAISERQLVESGGGGSRTKTLADAIKHDAMVRVRPISNRRDLVAVIKIY